MLTDTALKSLKPRETVYTITDRDRIYAVFLTSGAVSFRYDTG